MANLSFAYHKLFDVPGYTFIVEENGEVCEWGSNEAQTRFGETVPTRIHLVPGSFNPLHESHKELFESATDASPHTFFEMSVERVDKAMVTLPQLDRRLQQFRGLAPVVVSRAPRFVEKIGIYLSRAKGVTFHVGIDCITRMKDDYGLWGIQGLAARFVVHDRIMNGRHMSLGSEFGDFVPKNCVPAALVRSPESLARSSSQIRRENGER